MTLKRVTKPSTSNESSTRWSGWWSFLGRVVNRLLGITNTTPKIHAKERTNSDKPPIDFQSSQARLLDPTRDQRLQLTPLTGVIGAVNRIDLSKVPQNLKPFAPAAAIYVFIRQMTSAMAHHIPNQVDHFVTNKGNTTLLRFAVDGTSSYAGAAWEAIKELPEVFLMHSMNATSWVNVANMTQRFLGGVLAELSRAKGYARDIGLESKVEAIMELQQAASNDEANKILALSVVGGVILMGTLALAIRAGVRRCQNQGKSCCGKQGEAEKLLGVPLDTAGGNFETCQPFTW